MRHFSFRPSLTMSGREVRGLRGLAGKPTHPPLTDIPVAAYLFAAVFDIVSVAIQGASSAVARELFLAASWVLIGGLAVSVLAALTGWADWHYSSEAGTQARRTINAHAITMIGVTVVALVDVLVRLTAFAGDAATPVGMMILSIVAAAGVTVGATMGGGLVFDYGFNVETAGDHPVWHVTEVDVRPGHYGDATAADAGTDGQATDIPAPDAAVTGAAVTGAAVTDAAADAATTAATTGAAVTGAAATDSTGTSTTGTPAAAGR